MDMIDGLMWWLFYDVIYLVGCVFVLCDGDVMLYEFGVMIEWLCEICVWYLGCVLGVIDWVEWLDWLYYGEMLV